MTVTAATRHDLMRRVLWVGAVANLGAALVFAFPASMLGQLAGLPIKVPSLYSGMVAFLVALFGATYAWLARQPTIDRPLVGLAAIGKTGVVTLTFVLWLFDHATTRSLMFISGDLVFASLFAWWLFTTGDER